MWWLPPWYTMYGYKIENDRIIFLNSCSCIFQNVKILNISCYISNFYRNGFCHKSKVFKKNWLFHTLYFYIVYPDNVMHRYLCISSIIYSLLAETTRLSLYNNGGWLFLVKAEWACFSLIFFSHAICCCILYLKKKFEILT